MINTSEYRKLYRDDPKVLELIDHAESLELYNAAAADDATILPLQLSETLGCAVDDVFAHVHELRQQVMETSALHTSLISGIRALYAFLAPDADIPPIEELSISEAARSLTELFAFIQECGITLKIGADLRSCDLPPQCMPDTTVKLLESMWSGIHYSAESPSETTVFLRGLSVGWSEYHDMLAVALQERVLISKQTAAFYADEDNYVPPTGPIGRIKGAAVEEDGGKIMRAALEQHNAHTKAQRKNIVEMSLLDD